MTSIDIKVYNIPSIPRYQNLLPFCIWNFFYALVQGNNENVY